jgi:hypothetical protein
VHDTHHGDDEAIRNFRESPTMTDLERGDWCMYRNAFWVIERDARYTGSGIYGQHCYIDVPAGVTIARFSTYPIAYPQELWDETMRSLTTISAALA